MRPGLTVAAILFLIAAPAPSGEPAPAPARSVLDEEIVLAIKEQPFPEFMRALRNAVPDLVTPTDRAFPGQVPRDGAKKAITLVSRLSKPEPQVLRLKKKDFLKKEEEYNRLLETEGSASWVSKNGQVLYSLDQKRPMTIRAILEAVAALNDLQVVTAGKEIRLARYAELPLDFDAIAAEAGLPRPEPPKDLKAALRVALQARADAATGGRSTVVTDKDGRPYTAEQLAAKGRVGPGDVIKFVYKDLSPEAKDPDVMLKAALAGLKGHPGKDVVRAWLLCAMCCELQKHCWMGLSARQQAVVVSAAREILEIVESPRVQEGRKELAELQEGFVVDNGYDAVLFAAAGISDDYAEAVKLAAAAARMHTLHCCDVYYDTYYHILSGQRHLGQAKFADLVVKDAEKELARREKNPSGQAEPKEDWTGFVRKPGACPWCGKPLAEHFNYVGDRMARAHFRLGQALRAAGRNAEAAAHLEKAVAIDPADGGNSERIALGGQDPHKILDVGSAQKTEADMARAKAEAGDVDGAIAVLRERFLARTGNETEAARREYLNALDKYKRYQEAVGVLREEIKRDRQYEYELTYSLARFLEKAGDTDGAIAAWERVREMSPKNRGALAEIERLRKLKADKGKSAESAPGTDPKEKF